ncbi:MAG: sigma-70 family RNA polymerase sigma factor [Candidatus Edwardsbacteria bacterium]
MREETDVELIHRFKNGEEKAFDELVKRHQKKIYFLILRIVRHPEDAADLAQETFIRAYRSLMKFKEKSEFYTWLHKIAVNLSLNFKRRKPLEESLNTIHEMNEDILEEEINHKRRQEMIRKAVEKLPVKQRAVFVMHYYEEMPHQEIAEVMGRTVGSVKANYFQAVQKLRKMLQKVI